MLGICELCGNHLPRGEEMFRYHGYSGPCPPTKQKSVDERYIDELLDSYEDRKARGRYKLGIRTYDHPSLLEFCSICNSDAVIMIVAPNPSKRKNGRDRYIGGQTYWLCQEHYIRSRR